MLHQPFFLLTATVGFAAAAVDVVFYKGISRGSLDCGTTNMRSVWCTDLEETVCCGQYRGEGFDTVKFLGLGSAGEHIATAFRFDGEGIRSPCSVPCNSTSGSGCVGCKDLIGGGSWRTASKKRDVHANTTCTGKVKPDLVAIDGHYFKINHDVPANATAEILKAESYVKMPVHLLRYEVVKPARA